VVSDGRGLLSLLFGGEAMDIRIVEVRLGTHPSNSVVPDRPPGWEI
jgi:hypothetical protein